MNLALCVTCFFKVRSGDSWDLRGQMKETQTVQRHRLLQSFLTPVITLLENKNLFESMPEVTIIQKASREFKSLNDSEKDILDSTACTWNIHLDRWAQSLHIEPWLACGHSPWFCDSSDPSSHKCLSWPPVLGCGLLYLREALAGVRADWGDQMSV